jgi:UDP-glucose:(heptosyl)LPS alpha-1,3-glucosyltransferase
MRIAFALEKFSAGAGGAESYAVQLAVTLVNEGWDVHLYGHEWDGVPRGATFHRIPRPPRFMPASLRLLWFALLHRRMARRTRYDVMVGFGATVLMNVYQSHGGVHVLTTQRKLAAVRNPLLRLFRNLSTRVLPKHAVRRWVESAPFRMSPRPLIVAISDLVANDMESYFHVPRSEMRLVYNGIDLRRFAPAAGAVSRERRESMGLGDETIFLFMSYDLRKTGARTLVEAAGILRDRIGAHRFMALFVGGPPYGALSRLVTNLRLENVVKFLGPTNRPEEMYTVCDAFVLPTFYDACSLVIFEAMASGLPCITSAWNGAAGIIKDGEDGIIIDDPSNPGELASAMERLMDPHTRALISTAALKKVSRYGLETNHKKMISVFEEAARSHPLSA